MIGGYATPLTGLGAGTRFAATTSSLAGGSGDKGPPETGVTHTCIMGGVNP